VTSELITKRRRGYLSLRAFVYPRNILNGYGSGLNKDSQSACDGITLHDEKRLVRSNFYWVDGDGSLSGRASERLRSLSEISNAALIDMRKEMNSVRSMFSYSSRRVFQVVLRVGNPYCILLNSSPLPREPLLTIRSSYFMGTSTRENYSDQYRHLATSIWSRLVVP